MAKRKRSSGTATAENRIKEGRGQGKGPEYKPWLHIQDVPSQGLSSRIKGWKTRRVHHLLSELESSYFYVLEWSEVVSDIREQFPLLPLEETQAIAEGCQIAHPSDPRTKEPIVMTTDFLVTVNQKSQAAEQARTIKHVQDLQSKRTLEKLEIERRYWQKRNIDWGIVTEREISVTLVDNIKWLHPYRDLDSLQISQNRVNQVASVMPPEILREDQSLAEITAMTDDQLGLAPGTSLSVVRHLLATRIWKTDMNRPILPNENLILSSPPLLVINKPLGELA